MIETITLWDYIFLILFSIPIGIFFWYMPFLFGIPRPGVDPEEDPIARWFLRRGRYKEEEKE